VSPCLHQPRVELQGLKKGPPGVFYVSLLDKSYAEIVVSGREPRIGAYRSIVVVLRDVTVFSGVMSDTHTVVKSCRSNRLSKHCLICSQRLSHAANPQHCVAELNTGFGVLGIQRPGSLVCRSSSL